MSKIVEQLRDARKFRGMKSSELARRSGIRASYISQLEHGVNQPSADTIERIAEALDMVVLVVPKKLIDE